MKHVLYGRIMDRDDLVTSHETWQFARNGRIGRNETIESAIS